MAEAGVPGYEAISIAGVFAPAGLPEAAATRLNREIVRVLQRPDIKEKFLRTGVETIGSTPGEFSDTVRAEMARMGKVIKEAGIRVQ
jgi:tripartite-type tricarboxylate transporter receptor subunit TctC